MNDIKQLVTSKLRNFTAYKASSQDYEIILNANEHYTDILNEKLKDSLIKAVEDSVINRYPDPESNHLCEVYGNYLNISPECVVATVGSDEGIRIISDTFLDSEEYAISAVPTFSMYSEIARLAKGNFIGVESDREDLAPDIDKIIKVANEYNGKIIYVCSPNNPTGYIYSKEDIKKIIDNTKGVVAIDEAYVDFSMEDNLDLINYSNRVVILRTLSKAFCGAAIRVGFLIGSKEVIDCLKIARLPYNLSTTSAKIGEVLIKNHEIIESYVKDITEEREKILKVLKSYKEIFIFPINANFILIRSDKSQKLYDECEKKSISIRNFHKEIKNCVRISIGAKEENEKLIKVIKEVYDE